MTLALTVLSSRVIQLQWLSNDGSDATQKRSLVRTEVKPAYRGLIVDRNEEPLVVNVPLTDLHVDRYHMDDENVISWAVAYRQLQGSEKWLYASEEEREDMLSERRFYLINNALAVDLIREHKEIAVELLATPLKIPADQLMAELDHPKKRSFRLKKDLAETEASYLKRLMRENYLFGFDFKKQLTRHYPNPTLATHLIGFTRDYTGQAGLELRYNDQLAGQDGYHKRRSNPNNLSIYNRNDEIKQPTPGLNMVLSIDLGLQAIVDEELEAGLKHAQAQQGCAILMQPETGEILALASRPHYNLNTKEGIADGSRNYIFKSALEPGSTIKVLTAAAAMNERLVYPRTSINCENGYFNDGGVIVKDAYPRSSLTVTEILAQSNNIGTYKIGRQLGRERFFDYLASFGIGAPYPPRLAWRGHD